MFERSVRTAFQGRPKQPERSVVTQTPLRPIHVEPEQQPAPPPPPVPIVTPEKAKTGWALMDRSKKNPDYVTKLRVLEALALYGGATIAEVAEATGLSRGQVEGCVRRMMKCKHRCIERSLTLVGLFPKGEAHYFRLASFGMFWLKQARAAGWTALSDEQIAYRNADVEGYF